MNDRRRKQVAARLAVYDNLSKQLYQMEKMKEDLERGTTLRQLNVFGANVCDLIHIPEVEDFRIRLKVIIQNEVNKEISRIEGEILNV